MKQVENAQKIWYFCLGAVKQILVDQILFWLYMRMASGYFKLSNKWMRLYGIKVVLHLLPPN